MPTLSAKFLRCCLWVVLLMSATASAGECDPWLAKLVSVEGDVDVHRAGPSQWQAASLGQFYCHGDRIRVGDQARASIELNNDTILRLDQQTTLVLPESPGESLSFIELARGFMHLISRVKNRLEVRTPFVNAGLEGTEFIVRVFENEAIVSVIEGKVAVSNPHGRLSLSPGQSASGTKDTAPVLRLDLRPSDAVQWAVYYPLVTDPAAPGVGADVAEAQRLVSVGRVDGARLLIDRVRTKAPNNVDALAIASIIELAQNNRPAARQLAAQAVSSETVSVMALLALSFVQQADFELEAATVSVERALEIEPDNPIAWSRLAEMRSSLGDRRGALQAAERAVELNPRLSRTQTVLGFSQLTHFQTAAARAAFNEAIELDSADPLARLGLGLTKIRDGELADGRREIEIAVSLDPSNSLVRSYLGKAYFAEGRNAVAETEYELAKQLDPLDPTPWLYSAVLNNVVNRNIIAFDDYQESIKRNDNRGVYRSRLLLDRDNATRSASLGRVYSSLEFGQRGLLEGWLSTTQAPADYSGHRFLADTYGSLPRHEVAQVSELLQAQLLQPVGLVSVQPQLAESSLQIVGSATQAALSRHELGGLFARDGVRLTTGLLVAGNNTEAADLVVASQHGPVAFSLGSFHFATDGFHKNNGQEQDVLNLVTHAAVSPDTTVLVELRSREVMRGEPLRFFAENFLQSRRTKNERDTFRIGARHAITPRDDLLLIATREHEDQLTDFTYPNRIIYNAGDVDQVSYEGRYLLVRDGWNATFGVVHESTDSNGNFINTLPPFLGGGETPTLVDTEHTTLYAYSQTAILSNLDFSLGISADLFEQDLATSANRSNYDRTLLNPKIGLIWQLQPATMLRLGLSRSMTKINFSDQTIEPTHVVGFNQFFDDTPGTESLRYGASVDHRFPENSFFGMEYSARELEIPVEPNFTSYINYVRFESSERLYRSYFYKIFSESWAGSAEYLYEKIDPVSAIAGIYGYQLATTHRFPITLSYNAPSGLSAKVKATYIDQKGIFAIDPGASSFAFGQDRFWVLDFSLEYPLPSNRGRLSFGVENVFNAKFNFQDTDVNRPSITPERTIHGQVSLWF